MQALASSQQRRRVHSPRQAQAQRVESQLVVAARRRSSSSRLVVAAPSCCWVVLSDGAAQPRDERRMLVLSDERELEQTVGSASLAPAPRARRSLGCLVDVGVLHAQIECFTSNELQWVGRGLLAAHAAYWLRMPKARVALQVATTVTDQLRSIRSCFALKCCVASQVMFPTSASLQRE
jgi:hypothetical protein